MQIITRNLLYSAMLMATVSGNLIAAQKEEPSFEITDSTKVTLAKLTGGEVLFIGGCMVLNDPAKFEEHFFPRFFGGALTCLGAAAVVNGGGDCLPDEWERTKSIVYSSAKWPFYVGSGLGLLAAGDKYVNFVLSTFQTDDGFKQGFAGSATLTCSWSWKRIGS